MIESRRLMALGLAAAILAVVLIWRWVAGWGLVTVDFVDAPVGKVLAALQRQTGLTLLTNASPETQVTLRVRRAPAFEALDLLAARLDGEMRVVFCIAPDRAAARAGLEALKDSPRAEDWRVFSGGWGRGSFGPGESAVDLRRVSLFPSPQEDSSLHAFLAQAAMKSGVTFVAPRDWNPELAKLPGRGTVAQVASSTARSVRGQLAEAVLITVRPEGSRMAGERGRDGFAGAGGQPRERAREAGPGDALRERGISPPNPEWIAERVEAQIALLPKEEQAQAREDARQMRAIWEEVRNLPEDQRRAKWEEMMSRPEVQERIEERVASRDMKGTPEQRAQRYKRYVERKRQFLGNP